MGHERSPGEAGAAGSASGEASVFGVRVDHRGEIGHSGVETLLAVSAQAAIAPGDDVQRDRHEVGVVAAAQPEH